MPRGGKRFGAGAKSSWNNPPTTTIRVPSNLASKLLEIARTWDNGESVENLINSLSSERQGSSSSVNSSPTYKHKDNLKDMPRKVGIEGLYYITHIDNINSILEIGILSNSQVEQNKIYPQTIYNSQVIGRRGEKCVNDKSLWEFANLYFQPRNAMLYSLINQKSIHEIAILCVKKSLLNKKTIFIATGNAASPQSSILPIEEGKKLFKDIRNQIDKDWWNKDDGSKRTIMAECLVPDKVDSKYIQSIYVASEKGKRNLESKLSNCSNPISSNIPISIEPKRFFQPDWRASVADNISIVSGDMFFSRMQTLTISVNCVGVMGKGLASTAKHRFPDVYVKYENICKKKQLKIGQPYLYKRESSVLDDLYDEYLSLENIDTNHQTWFLLFPTKNHWRNKSTLSDIEEGLKWLCANFKNLGIESLAIPALGCGLGGLEWQDVGPLMCKYLVQIKIPVAIYLPTEKEIPNELVSANFLLSQVDF